ncbi:MAG TPA: bifunctional DNA-formamidopyrimidine glycosylase/DNA-(apurinic or apyrimidinic site) lyase [Thermoflexia bacterium]|jgi:formamidopyrimidine-DNA glycosylase|nr:bifunctional DNA-formamidopyrimidine glycosylase/DNA-(apurinic or apyrimidinic site) lyase [Thermoflexia bacterium]
MPELPEVETIVRGLQGLVGRRIADVEVRWERTVAVPDVETFVRRLQGRRIEEIKRRGKWVVIRLDGDLFLLIHLRMSGRLVVGRGNPAEDRHLRVALALDDGSRLFFFDPRKFGRMALVEDPGRVVEGLGPEPLDEGFTVEQLRDRLAGRRARLKPLLLDQRVVAGLGNIYADEVLWRAGLHPLRRADRLTEEEVARLHRAIREVLEEAIAGRGTTLEDGQYVGADGQPGDFAPRLAVYRRAGQPCPRCGTPIQRARVGGRGTHFCPRCQT